MKRMLRLSVLPALLLMIASAAYAGSITLASYGTQASNPGVANGALIYNGFLLHNDNTNGVGPKAFGKSYNVDPLGVWAGPIPPLSSWVSNSPSGGPPNGDPAANGAVGDYFYSTTFNIDASRIDLNSPYFGGSLSLLADDTMAVFLNGIQIVPFGDIGGDGHCADGKPTCGDPSNFDAKLLTIAIPGSDLRYGLNTLSFVDWQSYLNSPAGVDFAAVMGTPEPGSLLLLGTGLLALALLIFRKAKGSPRLILNM
jgi:PEP-CTERM motif